MPISLSDNALEKFLGFLTKADTDSKKRAIKKLTDSIESGSSEVNSSQLFGAWEDTREAEEIIRDIREARKDKNNIIDFE